MVKSGSQKLHICPKVYFGYQIDYNGVGDLRGQWHLPSKNLPKYPPPPLPSPGNRILNVSFVIILNGQIYTDSLVHDEKALKLLVDTIGQVKSSVTFWL